MWAVLSQALTEIRYEFERTPPGLRGRVREGEAYAWFQQRGDRWLMSFESICTWFGMPPDRLRGFLELVIDSRDLAAMKRLDQYVSYAFFRLSN